MNSYILSAGAVMLVIIAVLYLLLGQANDKVAKLTAEVALKEKQAADCARVNQENTEEFAKIVAANADAIKISKDAIDKSIKEKAASDRRLLEIFNAKDNGSIPGVLQRTLDGLRSRSASYQDSKGSS